VTQHNELQKFPALQRAIALAVGMKQEEEGVTRLGETLTPVIDFWSNPEWSFLYDEVLWDLLTPTVAAGGAAAASKIQVIGSPGLLLRIEKLINPSSNQVAFRTSTVLTAGWTLGLDPHFRDSRWDPGSPNTIPRMLTQTVENATGFAGTSHLIALPSVVTEIGLILEPATSLIIDVNALNVAFPTGMTLIGRARRLSTEELNG